MRNPSVAPRRVTFPDEPTPVVEIAVPEAECPSVPTLEYDEALDDNPTRVTEDFVAEFAFLVEPDRGAEDSSCVIS